MKLKTKVDSWLMKGRLDAVDLLSVEQAKVCLHTLDAEFKWYHMDVVDLLVDESEIHREETVMDEHKTESLIYLLASRDFLLLPSLQSRQKARN